MKFCPGLDKDEYQQYREVIWYDSRITISPIERINSIKCRKWFQVPGNARLSQKCSESVMCLACKKLRNELQ